MLSQELLQTIPQFIRVIRRLSVDQLDGSITLHHLRLLVLTSEGKTQSQMGEALQISLPAVSKGINGLAQRKLIRRRPDKDRRCHKLNLTPKGRKVLDEVSLEVEKEIQAGLDKLSRAQNLDLEKGLIALNKLMIHLKED